MHSILVAVSEILEFLPFRFFFDKLGVLELLFDDLRPKSVLFFDLLKLFFFAFLVLVSHNFRVTSFFLFGSQNSPLYFHFLVKSLLSKLLYVVLSAHYGFFLQL